MSQRSRVRPRPPATVEYFRGHLYVATNEFPPEEGAPDGRIMRIRVN